MYNILFTNAGRRATLLKNFKESLGDCCKIVALDNWAVAPALFVADKYYLSPKITDDKYIEYLLDICRTEDINVIMTLIDPEIELIAQNKDLFIKNGVLPLCPELDTARLCFDKYAMYEYLVNNNINTVTTFKTLEAFKGALENGDIEFPVFMKPRTGSGSVGAVKVDNLEMVENLWSEAKYDYIIQEFMDCEDFDADVYIDTISNRPVSIFSKKKIETRIGGASKTISFKDDKLFDFIKKIVKVLKLQGPVDMDFFYKDGEYYLSEINPRFGGAYLHAFGAGVDFPKLIAKNVDGKENESIIGQYDDGVIMLMYDSVVIVNEKDLKGDYND